jgi:hypothetical protein
VPEACAAWANALRNAVGSVRELRWKDAEILMLRHQLAVAERERPKARARLTWPVRAWLALLAGAVPTGNLAGMRYGSSPVRP